MDAQDWVIRMPDGLEYRNRCEGTFEDAAADFAKSANALWPFEWELGDEEDREAAGLETPMVFEIRDAAHADAPWKRVEVRRYSESISDSALSRRPKNYVRGSLRATTYHVKAVG